MQHNVWPPALLHALAQHGRDLEEGSEYDGRLATAITSHIRERLGDGVSSASVRGMVSYPGRALLDLTPPGVTLAALDVDALRDVVTRALGAGYCPTTIKGKHLQLVRVLCQRYGEHDAVGEVKRRMRAVLAYAYAPPPRFTADDLACLFRRIAEYPQRLRTRRRDLAVIRLLALRAIRMSELARIQIRGDVHLSIPALDIKSKVRRLPRRVELSAGLADDVRALSNGRTTGPLVLGGEKTINSLLEKWKGRLDEPRLNQRHLRRSCASELAYNGAPLPVLRATLGHARNSAQTVRYLLDDAQRTREALRTLEHRSRPYPGAAT